MRVSSTRVINIVLST